jgi:hypothetical protein
MVGSFTHENTSLISPKYFVETTVGSFTRQNRYTNILLYYATVGSDLDRLQTLLVPVYV